jgi:hypothetical protein
MHVIGSSPLLVVWGRDIVGGFLLVADIAQEEAVRLRKAEHLSQEMEVTE